MQHRLLRIGLTCLLAGGAAACSQGVYGTVLCRQTETAAATVLDAQGLGVTVADLAYDRGLTLGWIRRTYLYPAGSAAAGGGSWGACRGLAGADPVVADRRSVGVEFSLSASATGMSVGYSSSFVRMPIEEGRSVRLSYTYVRGHPELARAELCEGDRCGSLSPPVQAPSR